MYARIPPDLYQQPITQSRPDPYSANDPVDGIRQRYAPMEPSNYDTQETIQDRHRRYERVAPGLGKSMLANNPFVEESDSNEDGPSDEADVQGEDVERRSTPLFVNSSDSTRLSQANFQDGRQYGHRATGNSLSNDTSGIHSSDQQSQPIQTRDARSGQHYSYRVPTRDDLPHTMRGQHGGAMNQTQPATARRAHFKFVDTTQMQPASSHDQARDSRAVLGGRPRSEHRHAPEMPLARQQPIHTQARTQLAFGHEPARDSRALLRENLRPGRRYVPEILSAGRGAVQKPQPSHKHASDQSFPSGIPPSPMSDIRPRKSLKLEGYNPPKNILSTVRPRKSDTDRPGHGQLKEDMQYPAQIAASTSPEYRAPVTPIAPVASFAQNTPTAPIIQPTARYDAPSPSLRPGSSTSDSIQERINTIPEEQLRNFIPNSLDKQVWEYRHRADPMDWQQIKEILDLTAPPYVLDTVKTRQRIYEAKRKLDKQETTTTAEEIVEQALAPIIPETVAPAATTATSVLPPTPINARPVPPSPAVQADAKRLSETLEEERLLWATKEAELQERIKALESESATKTAELKEHEKQLKLKVEVQEKYQKLKEEAQTYKENFKAEKDSRVKAERDLRTAQSDINRRALAAAGAARNKGKAVDNGFTFSNDDEDEDVRKKTPTKRSNARKPAASSNLRDDGHPQTAGKSLPPAAIQALYKHLNKCKDEDEEKIEGPPDFIQEEELSYFVYTVFRKQWSHDAEEPDDDTKIGCGNFTYLNEANVAVTNEILRPHGNASAIKIDPNEERSLHQGMGEFNMAWAQLDVPGGHVKVWVERQLHTEFEGKLPLFEDKGILYKQVWAIRQETTSAAAAAAASDTTSETTGPTITTIEESDEIYTTFDLANRKANEKVFNMLWPEETSTPGSSARKTTLSAVKAKEDARQDRKQRLDDLEDRRELFAEEVDGEDGSKVKVFVVQKTVTGPRN
ncbi:hypothetical protein KCU62_g8748, partial [Aureobasidium sp. EXF-3399]